MGGRWVAFVAVLLIVVLTVLAAQLPLDTWVHVAWAGVVGEAFAVAVVLGARQRFTHAYRPQTNGKAERFNRTLADE